MLEFTLELSNKVETLLTLRLKRFSSGLCLLAVRLLSRAGGVRRAICRFISPVRRIFCLNRVTLLMLGGLMKLGLSALILLVPLHAWSRKHYPFCFNHPRLRLDHFPPTL